MFSLRQNMTKSLKTLSVPKAHRKNSAKSLTARALLHSGIVGMWKSRKDIHSSAAFARGLRNRAEKRKGF